MEGSTRHAHKDSESHPVRAGLIQRSIRRFSAIELLVVLVVWLVSLPFVLGLRNGDLIETVLATVVLLSAMAAVGGRRRTLIVAIVLMIPAFVGKWGHHYRPDLVPPEVFTTAGVLFLAFVVVHLLRFVLTAPQVSTDVVCAAISGYLLMGVFWAFLYFLVDQVVPTSFVFNVSSPSSHSMAGFEAVYFSFVTLSTIGYGDITPVSRVARMLSVTEATTGMFYMTVLIARLVAVYSRAPRTGSRR